jgi:hypothetical protein
VYFRHSSDDGDLFRGANVGLSDNGAKFSTFDKDNDLYAYQCVYVAPQGGWWFNACGLVFFTGDNPLVTLDGGSTWLPVSEVHVMVKAR